MKKLLENYFILVITNYSKNFKNIIEYFREFSINII